MRNLIFLISKAQRNFRNELFGSVEARQFHDYETAFSYQVKAQPNFCIWNFTTQCKYRTFCNFWQKRVNNLLKIADIYQYFDRNGTKLRSMYKIALLTEKKKKNLKAQRN